MEKESIFLNHLLANLPGFVYWKDKDSRYQACNENLAVVMKLASREQICGLSDYDFPWAGQYADQFIQEDRHVMRTRQLLVTEHTFPVDSQNEDRHAVIRTEKRPFYDGTGEVIGVLAVAVDITEQRAAEAKEQAAIRESLIARTQASAESELRQAIAILAGSVTHDLRTLVASIASVSDMLQMYLPMVTASYESAIPTTHQGGISKRKLAALDTSPQLLGQIHQKMSLLISNNLETLSNLNSENHSKEKFIRCSIENCIQDTLDYYPFKSGEKCLIKWKKGYDFDFLGDHISFFRVLTNLINNALRQIILNHGGEIYISTKDKGDNNILCVQDSAGGMSSEIKESLFMPYQTKRAKGTGIGLAYCRMTMRHFGGDIICRSTEGVGTEFDLIFPKYGKLDISSDSEVYV